MTSTLARPLRITIVLLLVIIASGSLLFAQQDQYQFNLINVKNGLSNNQINTIIKDEWGFMWFGTQSGLNRYDGYDFKTFKHTNGDSATISDDYITRICRGPDKNLWISTRYGWNIFDHRTEKFTSRVQPFLSSIGIVNQNFTFIEQDKQNNFWFILPGTGLYKYDASTKKTTFYNNKGKDCSLYSNNVNSIASDYAGAIWISYSEGILEKLDIKTNRIVRRTEKLQQQSNNEKHYYRLFCDSENEIWIYCWGSAKGVFYYNPATDVLLPINENSDRLRLSNDIVRGITQDNKGNIWVATDHGGVNLIDKKNLTIQYLVNSRSDSKSISQNSVNSIYKDNNGIIWLGTTKKGVSYFHESSLKFPLYQHKANDPGSLIYNDVNRFVEDKKGNLWIGTNGGGLVYFDRTNGSYTQYLHSAANANSLSNNVVVSLFLDRQGKLWIGSYFGGLDCFDGKNFTHYKHQETDPDSLADDNVWEIFEDSQNRLWIGTLNQGLDLFDRIENKFTHYKQGTGNTLRSNYVSSVMEDKAGNIWVGTGQGIDILDRSTLLFTHLEHAENNKNTLSHNNVADIFQDSRGLFWIATRNGLNVYDTERQEFKLYTVDDGLPDNTILAILEDDNHNLWVSTNKGLCNIFIPKSFDKQQSLQFKNYDENDGLQSRQFNEFAALKTSKGELIFGGPEGFNIFHPSKIREKIFVPNLVLTNLQIFNKSVKIGDTYDGLVVLPETISTAKTITLNYNQNVFTLEFAALSFINAHKIRYAYKLAGFNQEWLITDGANRKATFTNLNHGNYTFLIKAINEDGVWSKDPVTLSIVVLPPFWLTPFAYFIYVLVLITALVFSRKLIIRRAGLRFQIEQERREAQQLHELDMMKIKFFTNVSHEFRTPLSLIITPLEKLIKQAGQLNDKKQFQLIHRNARRLLNMVNTLLDFRKLEEQELNVNNTPGDIVQFIKDLSFSFSDIAENKKIVFSFNSTTDHVYTMFDHDKVERIIFNLLSNAFKFTQNGGAINVLIDVKNDNHGRVLLLKVIDTGLGISSDVKGKIFDRFFQNQIPGSMVNQGSGIGLAITKEFVKLQGGTIDVESEPDKGSSFNVWLPVPEVERQKFEEELIEVAPDENLNSENTTVLPGGLQKATKKPGKRKSILLVEDNEDFRSYIKDNLSEDYNIIEAQNGKSGWNKTLAEHPDLVLCDINMPEMNGIDLCKKIKADSRTSFIPVILLTALTGEEQQLAGLQTGANDYMTKPFNFEILLSKIQNLLFQQDSFKKVYQKQVQANPSPLEVTESVDEKFIKQALEVIEKNISNAEFSVEEMSRQMFMSRVALYKKIFGLSGKTPIEFIRSVRLKRAAQLLQKGELTVAEVAYEVGFNNPKYFSRYFKEEYNVLPSSFISDKKRQVED